MTLYNSYTDKLYYWVRTFFNSHRDVRHLLVTKVLYKGKRMRIIRKAGMEKYFERIYLGVDKRVFFEEIISKIPKETILVVGDNLHNEIALAKSLGIDSLDVRNIKMILGQ